MHTLLFMLAPGAVLFAAAAVVSEAPAPSQRLPALLAPRGAGAGASGLSLIQLGAANLSAKVSKSRHASHGIVDGIHAIEHILEGPLVQRFVYGAARQIPTTTGDEPQCLLLADTMGVLAQLLLGGLCAGSLLVKWYLEEPRRRFLIFCLDFSKQIIGALWYHFLNMALAVYLEQSHGGLKADECAWYFINFMVDTTVGLTLNLVGVRLSEKWFGYESGNYWIEPKHLGAEPQLDWNEWYKQISIYVAIVSSSKMMVFSLMMCVPQVASKLGVAGTTWITNVDQRLIFIMVVVPLVMDTAFFWITDEFIKATVDDSVDSKLDSK